MLSEKENHEYNTAQQGNIRIKIGNIDNKKSYNNRRVTLRKKKNIKTKQNNFVEEK